MSIITKFGRLEKEEEERERETGEGVALPFIVDNFLSLYGGEMKENLNMGNKQIINIADPVNPQDVATKNYVDKAGGHTFFTKNRDGDFIASESLKMNGKQIQGLPLPVQDQDAATKIYADTLVEQKKRILEVANPFSFQNDEHTAKDSINMKNFKIVNVGKPENKQDAVNVKYFTDNSGFLRKNGGFDAQDHICLKNKKLGGLREPRAAGKATNKKYVDDENEKIKENTLNKFEDGTNYKLKANMDLNTFRVFNVSTPQREDEAANKKYVDDLERNQPFETRNGKTYDAKGNLNMKQKRISNIPEPTDEDDVANKGYVDKIDEFFKGKIGELETAHKTTKKENLKIFFYIATINFKKNFSVFLNIFENRFFFFNIVDFDSKKFIENIKKFKKEKDDFLKKILRPDLEKQLANIDDNELKKKN